MNCPKCGAKNSIETTTVNYVTSFTHCIICGCAHVPGAQRESLYRQIHGTEPSEMRNRRQNTPKEA